MDEVREVSCLESETVWISENRAWPCGGYEFYKELLSFLYLYYCRQKHKAERGPLPDELSENT